MFNLPERAVAKARRQLIADDELHFEAIARALETATDTLTKRLATERTLPTGVGREAVERDQRIYHLSGRLRTMRRYGVDLCLGRMVRADDGEALYIGRLGLDDGAGRRLLVDWRTPAAEPYFGATHAEPMGLLSRRRYRWNERKVIDFWDEVFDSAEFNGHAALDDQSAFIASLASSRSSRMRDVLSTIQADQDAIIRADSRGSLVVDGGPGTGKTVVALHRAAYLLYADARVGGGRGDVLVVGPHRPYLNYVSDVLPSLGEEGVRTVTISDLLPEGGAAVPEANPSVARLKGTVDMVRAIEPATRLYEEPPSEGMLVETALFDVWVSPDDWSEAFRAADPAVPHNAARDDIWNELVSILTDRVDREGVSVEAADKELRRNSELAKAMTRAWPLIDPADLVGDLWEVPAYLRMCAPWLTASEVSLLQRPEPQAWTVADLPLLDTAHRRLGDPETPRRRRRQEAAAAAERARMELVIDQLLQADNDEGPLGMLSQLRQHGIREALVDEASFFEPEVDQLAGPFSHIIVDEAQELSDAEWQMLLHRCPSGSFTIVGDRSQARSPFRESWEDRLRRIGLTRVRRASLTINYRTPVEVMDVAAPTITEELPDANVPTSVRSSGIPVTWRPTSDLTVVIDTWLDTHVEGTVCVIGSTELLSRPRVMFLDPAEAKGLEFDLVVAVNPDEFGSGVAGAVDRYVAMTRATQQLVVLTDSSADARRPHPSTRPLMTASPRT